MQTCRDLENLTVEERELLKEFGEKVKDVVKPYQKEAFLIRWLRAQKFDLREAEDMLRKHVKFYYNLGMDTLESYVPGKIISEYSGMKWLGLNKNGNAVQLYLAGSVDYKGFSRSVDFEEVGRWLMFQLGTMLSNVPSAGVEDFVPGRKFVSICDFNHMNLRAFLDTSVLKLQADIVRITAANFPELLETCYMINAPSYFSTWFSVAKTFIDPVTASKIQIYTDDYQSDLLEAISENILPRVYGGKRPDTDDLNTFCETFHEKSEVPSHYYLQDAEERLIEKWGKSSVTIEAGQIYVQDVLIEDVGYSILWSLRTFPYGVKFGVFFSSLSDKKSSCKDVESLQKSRSDFLSSKESIIPLEEVSSHTVTERGELLCEEPGTYTLYFDTKQAGYNQFGFITKLILFHQSQLMGWKLKSSKSECMFCC